MNSYSIKFIRYLLGLRPAYTGDTSAELQLLANLAANCKDIVEVGVFEGVASGVMRRRMQPDGILYLVDPYYHSVVLERMCHFSMAFHIARKELRPFGDRVRFIRKPSASAALEMSALGRRFDLIFIDARHDYLSVLEDFKSWSPSVAKLGLIAFHDSRICLNRPDLNSEVGSVQLVREIEIGNHGEWKLFATADSISVFQRAAGDGDDDVPVRWQPATPSANTKDNYDEWHRKVHGAESGEVLLLQQWHHDALALSPALGGRMVLEVGCGAGDFSFALERRGAVVIGIDFSQTAIDIAMRKRSQRKSKVKFLVGDACALQLPDSSFDVVFSCECLEHVPDPQKAVLEMSRVLRPEGILVLTTENYSNGMLIDWLRCWLTRQPFNSGVAVQPIEHFFIFQVIKRMMKRSGLTVTATTAAHHVFLVIPGAHPHLFVVERFRISLFRFLFKFLGRHWTFMAVKHARIIKE